MRSLDDATTVCEAFLPGLLDALAATPLSVLEGPDSPALDLFRRAGGPALLIPKTYSGLGATPKDALQISRALGSHAPSLAVATAMHHFSVATIFTLADSLKASGLEWALLEGIADQNLLVASAFGEGNSGQGILESNVIGTRTPTGLIVNGSKKPCSIARSMDLLSASAVVVDDAGKRENVILLIPANSAGVSVHPFWGSTVLRAAESEEVRLTDAEVDNSLVMPTSTGVGGELDDLQTIGFIWFEMMITSAYLGMASALVERAIDIGHLGAERVAEMTVRLETATYLLETVAHILDAGESDHSALAKVVTARYGAEDAIVDSVGQAVAALGGLAYINSPDVAYLASAAQCVRFHPPSRARTCESIAASVTGDVFRIR